MPLLLPRAGADVDTAYTLPDDTHNNGPSDKTTQIVIGVVVGGVAAIAITAGIIFIFIKKRKWAKLRDREEQLINYQLASGYSSKLASRSATPEDYLSTMASPPPTSTTTTYPYSYPYDPREVGTGSLARQDNGHGQGQRPGSRARGMSAPASTSLAISNQTNSPELPPPAYQSLHPRYDPSRYSQISTRFSSSFDIPRSSVAADRNNHPTIGIPQQYHYQPAPAGSALGSGPGYGFNGPSPSGATVTTTVSSGLNTNTTSQQTARSGPDPRSERGPRRPRPVLSRLITNL
ncbi:hypothetical protein BDV18DRAFT_162057 [Aspergillus unguis]